MTEITRAKVARTRSYLLESVLPEDTKDGLQTLLVAAAAAANGTQDRVAAMADAILALSLHEVRQAIRSPDAIQQAIHKHLRNCPLAGSTVRYGYFMALMMKPWPWITASVVAFSPHAPRIAKAIVEAMQ